jgi:hypothetical protein
VLSRRPSSCPFLLAAVLAAAALHGCAVPGPDVAASAITKGTPTDGDPGVVALLSGATLRCTATLVAPRVLLTAAHCLSGDVPPNAYFGSSPQPGDPSIAILDTRLHPQFDAATLENDLALALLSAPPPAGALPWPLPAGALDASAVGLPLRLVGFGRTGAGDTSPPRKRTGTSAIASLDATSLSFGPSPSQTCEGDSGGPAFATLGGAEVLVGVTSSGDPGCATFARDTRVDAFDASFVAPYLAATAEGAAQAGDRCWYAENCAPGAGACFPAVDDAARSFCSPPCGAGDACPAGLACLADGAGARLCRHAPPSPGAAGAPCADASQCTDGLCVARAGSASPVCARRCFPDLPGMCAAGSSCVATSEGAGAAACFSSAPSGCSAVPRSGADASSLASLLLALLLVARALRA